MTNKEILEIALRQSAYDMNCAPEDFFRDEPVITRSVKHEKARKYLPLKRPIFPSSTISSPRSG